MDQPQGTGHDVQVARAFEDRRHAPSPHEKNSQHCGNIRATRKQSMIPAEPALLDAEGLRITSSSPQRPPDHPKSRRRLPPGAAPEARK